MEWMNISYLAGISVRARGICLSDSSEAVGADGDIKMLFLKFLNWRVILGYVLLLGTTVINVFAYRGVELKVTPMIESTGIIWVTILAACFLGEKPSRKALLSIVVTVAGIIVFSM